MIETAMQQLLIATLILAAFVYGGSLAMGGFVGYVAAFLVFEALAILVATQPPVFAKPGFSKLDSIIVAVKLISSTRRKISGSNSFRL